MIWVFPVLILFFILTDVTHYFIPNGVIIPAILFGGWLTGNWLPALIMFLVGVYFYQQEKMCGGDVKLLALSGAFIGGWALPAFALSRITVWLYRIIFKHHEILPYAPFWGLACVPFLFVK